MSVVTRFPPEPNGYLHLGHAKAMHINFTTGNECYLRLDDTNPEAEKEEFVDHILDNVRWLGWTPSKITYCSDYFDDLLHLAVKLIDKGLAYVDHQTPEEIRRTRELRQASPWRDRPTEESRRLFDDMRRGKVQEGSATLRMKMSFESSAGCMLDLVAYRVKNAVHPRTGSRYSIYPSYDYAHCIVDSLEGITHSICSLEFESRKASYYWLLDALELRKPVVSEFSRLCVDHNVLSKRKLARLVSEVVDGWDDPRLLTLAGMRRRGVPPAAINDLCKELGMTRSEGRVPLHRLYHHVRAHLDATSFRCMAVLRPLRVVITNMPDNHQEVVQASLFPGRTLETYGVPLTRVLYIERSDFRAQDVKGFRGLAPGKTVMLRYAYPVTCHTFQEHNGQVEEVHVTYDVTKASKPKGVIHWVAEPSPGQAPPSIEVRLYDELFNSREPESCDDWLADVNRSSLEVVHGFGPPFLASLEPGSRIQLERLGYFCVDTQQRVLNRTCGLRC
ncbi:Glutamine--tRNA ligase [Chlorella vulgaris]